MGADTQSRNLPLTVSKPALLVDGSDAQFRLLIHRLLAFVGSLEAVRAGLGGMIGLSGVQYTILVCIAHLEDKHGIGVKEVASHLNYTGAFVTMETGRLVKLGLLEKRPNPNDKRRVILTITAKAHQLLSGLAPRQQQINDTLFATLDRKDFSSLLAISEGLMKDSRNAQLLVAYLAGVDAHMSEREPL